MLTETLANLCNRGLPRSVRARQLCRELAGRSLVLEVRGVVQLHIASTGETLTMTRGAQPADARLSVGPLGVLADALGIAHDAYRRVRAPACSSALGSSRPTSSCARRAQPSRASRSMPVSMFMSWSMCTRSSVTAFPDAPGA